MDVRRDEERLYGWLVQPGVARLLVVVLFLISARTSAAFVYFAF
jgi:hypothetical protein